MSWLALDIGGANLKAADGLGFVEVRPFALWQAPEQLSAQLQALLAAAPPANRLAVTMTGELADCFASRAEGVHAIVQAVDQVAAGREVLVYHTNGRLMPFDGNEDPLLAAASNWHALAAFAARFCAGSPGLVIDIGSTTSDVVPIAKGRVAASGRTDRERLQSGELVYAGVERTPLCALVTELPLANGPCPVAAELFATTLDAYLLLGDLPENGALCDTADGRPRTLEAARARLGRMVGDGMTRGEAERAAAAIREAQFAQLELAIGKVIARLDRLPETVVISGHGEFLARKVLERIEMNPIVISLASELGSLASRCATAHALAVLAREQAVA